MSAKKILVVEDDDVFRSLFKSLLELEGYRVRAVKNDADTVLKILDLEREEFGLVLLDIYKPRFGWLQTLKTIKMIAPHVPVAAMTGLLLSDEAEIEAQIAAHGAACCLTKPMGVESLLKVVRQYC